MEFCEIKTFPVEKTMELMIFTPLPGRANVLSCPRCKGSHDGIEIFPFTHVVLGEWKWWGICPTTREPIIFKEMVGYWLNAEVIDRALTIFEEQIAKDLIKAGDKALYDLLLETHFSLAHAKGYW